MIGMRPAPALTIAPSFPEEGRPASGLAPEHLPGAATGLSPGTSIDLSGARFEDLVAEMLTRLGEDPDREGLRKTPERVKKSLQMLTGGYEQTPEEVIGDAVFNEDIRDIVLVKDIEFYSMCEHHMLPFFGKVHIAYLPNGKHRRAVQAAAAGGRVRPPPPGAGAAGGADRRGGLDDAFHPHGVGVVIQASHLCMMMRGIERQHSSTLSVAMRGVYATDIQKREELFRLVLAR